MKTIRKRKHGVWYYYHYRVNQSMFSHLESENSKEFRHWWLGITPKHWIIIPEISKMVILQLRCRVRRSEILPSPPIAVRNSIFRKIWSTWARLTRWQAVYQLAEAAGGRRLHRGPAATLGRAEGAGRHPPAPNRRVGGGEAPDHQWWRTWLLTSVRDSYRKRWWTYTQWAPGQVTVHPALLHSHRLEMNPCRASTPGRRPSSSWRTRTSTRRRWRRSPPPAQSLQWLMGACEQCNVKWTGSLASANRRRAIIMWYNAALWLV